MQERWEIAWYDAINSTTYLVQGILSNVLPEPVHHSMRYCWGLQKSAKLHNLACHTTPLTKMYKGSTVRTKGVITTNLIVAEEGTDKKAVTQIVSEKVCFHFSYCYCTLRLDHQQS